MTEYYLQCLIKRAESEEALEQYQIEAKGLISDVEKVAVPVYRKEEENVWLS